MKLISYHEGCGIDKDGNQYSAYIFINDCGNQYFIDKCLFEINHMFGLIDRRNNNDVLKLAYHELRNER